MCVEIYVILVYDFERVTGMKVRGSQTEEIGYKCQKFYKSLLSGRRKQIASVRFFFSFLHKINGMFPLKFFVAMMTHGSA